MPLFRYGQMEIPETELATWQEFIQKLLTKHKRIFQYLKLKEEGQPIIQAISSSNTIAVSDRSLKDT